MDVTVYPTRLRRGRVDPVSCVETRPVPRSESSLSDPDVVPETLRLQTLKASQVRVNRKKSVPG